MGIYTGVCQKLHTGGSRSTKKKPPSDGFPHVPGGNRTHSKRLGDFSELQKLRKDKAFPCHVLACHPGLSPRLRFVTPG